MKRKVIFGALAALFLGGGIFTAVNLTQKPVMSDLNLANIEAMTLDNESSPLRSSKCCYPTGADDQCHFWTTTSGGGDKVTIYIGAHYPNITCVD